ncbi:S-layer homology domain-containing protein [Lysinibacillus endophyticus]|uniref:S-layer homology domain-containing protein n=1 Tax=Ureibacillus endophyticus TaxID=1978490 RepID=UPI00313597B7
MANQPKKYKKFVATAATATLVASAIAPVASAAGFSDVANNTHAEAINALAADKVINGYPDGTFKPNKDLTRSDVVKLLGKYLVSKGYSVPADAKTVQRFNDVPVDYKDQELVEYAALVKDAGVFKGSNNNLNAANKITRGQMALVVVRALDELNNVDLVNFVAGQDFDKEVIDLNSASKEQQGAIDVLDFFDITKTSKFNPNSTTTRGQFASFLYRAINTDFSDVTDVVVESVTAINNTTVEVKFEEAIEDINSLKFAIEGLEVKNAVVKQTSNKTAVITTAAQEAGKEYTITLDGEKIGTFKGVSAVLPTGVKVIDRSIQGVTGNEVTLKAQVTVAEGQSKAGIPVTFFIAGSADGLYPAVTAEAVTNEDGIATYSYTRYVAIDDTFTVYSTGDRSKFHTGKVHWGVKTQLVVEEVTTGNAIQNGANKTYKIKYVSPTSGGAVAGKHFNVAFLENIDVTTDKLVRTATVNGVNPKDVSGLTTETAHVVTDSNGEAVFTVSGTNAKVTPVVYEADASTDSYSSTALQVKAPTVEFAATQLAHSIEIKGEGSKDATIGQTNARKFTVSVKDKDGKAVANEVVKLSLQEKIDNVIGTDSPAYFVTFNADGTVASTTVPTLGNPFVVTTNANGEATFYLASNTNGDYGTPVAWIDINNANGFTNNQLEATEPHKIGETTYFWTEKLVAAKLVVKNDADGKEATSVSTEGIARYEFKLTNQSGKTVSSNAAFVSDIDARYNVSVTGAAVGLFDTQAKAQAFDAAYDSLVSGNTATQANIEAAVIAAGGKYVSPNRSEYVDVNNNINNALYVVSADRTKTSNVSVTASATATKAGTTDTFTLVVAEAKPVELKASNVVGTVETGLVASYNTANNTITLAGKDPVKYAGEAGKTYKFFGLGESVISDATAFLNVVKQSGATITYKVEGDTVTFTIIALGGGVPTDTVSSNAVVTSAASITVPGTYTQLAGTFALPTTTAEGYSITWAETTDTLNLASLTGSSLTVIQSSADDLDDSFVLTASVTDGTYTSTKAVTFTVKEGKLPAVAASNPVVVTHAAGSANLIAGETVAFTFSEELSAASAADVITALEAAIGSAGDVVVTTTDNKTFTATVQAGKTVDTTGGITVNIDATKVIDLAGNAAGTSGNVTFNIPAQS